MPLKPSHLPNQRAIVITPPQSPGNLLFGSTGISVPLPLLHLLVHSHLTVCYKSTCKFNCIIIPMAGCFRFDLRCCSLFLVANWWTTAIPLQSYLMGLGVELLLLLLFVVGTVIRSMAANTEPNKLSSIPELLAALSA